MKSSIYNFSFRDSITNHSTMLVEVYIYKEISMLLSVSQFGAACAIALAFVAWPIGGGFSKATGAWVSFAVFLVTTLTTFAVSYKEIASQPLPSVKTLLILSFLGFINGLACYYYASMTNPSRSDIPAGILVITVAVLMVIFAPILDMVLNQKQLSLQQWGGIGVICIGIVLVGNK